jgi:ferredoxin
LKTLPFSDSIILHFDDGDDDQRLDAHCLMRAADPKADIYVCGPRGYMDYVIGAAREAGLREAQLHVEHFGAEIDTDGDPFMVVTARSGLRITVAPDETMLSAIVRAGIQVEVGCHNGLCGSCLTRVVDGRPDHRDMVLTAEEKARNDRVALCCSRSQTPELVLDI